MSLRNRYTFDEYKLNRPSSSYSAIDQWEKLPKNNRPLLQDYINQGYGATEQVELNLLDEDPIGEDVLYEAGGEYSATAELAEGGGTLAGVTSTVSPEVAGGIGLGLGALGAGVVTGLVSKAYSTGATVPGTHYIGPGNPIDSGDPVSGADYDARKHDIGYGLDTINVSDLDNTAIVEFGDHFAENNLDAPALLGHLGLKAKQAVEKHTGQLYPGKLCLRTGEKMINIIRINGLIDLILGRLTTKVNVDMHLNNIIKVGQIEDIVLLQLDVPILILFYLLLNLILLKICMIKLNKKK